MAKTVLIATAKPFSTPARERMVRELEQGGLNVALLEAYDGPDELKSAAATANALIVRSDAITAQVMQAAPGLELIVRAGAGYDNIDIAYAEEHGIVVENTPGQNANAVAELALELMLAAVRPLDGTPGSELRGKILGVHGFGHIGRLVARLGRACGMTVRVYDMNIDLGAAREFAVTIVDSPDELYDGAHVVSLHIPETPGTRHSVGRDLLMRMHEDGVLINTARGGVVDEPGLADVLRTRPGFRYATDVAVQDPAIPEEFGKRVITTPRKQGAQTLEANLNAGLAAARQVVAYFSEGDTTFCVYTLIPPHLKDYTRLAVQLGKLNAAFIPQPREVHLTAYGELDAYRDTMTGYVLKGLFARALGEECPPNAAAEHARDRGLKVVTRDPDSMRGYGNALTIDFVAADGTSHSSRGRIDEGQLEASRIGEFKARMPLDPGLYVIASYEEGPGRADSVGHLLTDAGYNRVRLGAGPNIENTRAQAFFQVEKKHSPFAAQRAEVEQIAEQMRAIHDVHDVHVIDLA